MDIILIFVVNNYWSILYQNLPKSFTIQGRVIEKDSLLWNSQSLLGFGPSLVSNLSFFRQSIIKYPFINCQCINLNFLCVTQLVVCHGRSVRREKSDRTPGDAVTYGPPRWAKPELRIRKAFLFCICIVFLFYFHHLKMAADKVETATAAL